MRSTRTTGRTSLRALWARCRGWWRPEAADADFDQELASHLQLHVDELTRQGVPAGEAQRLARVRLGGVEGVKEAHRDRRGLPGLDTLVRDVRYGLRVWIRNPGIAVVGVLSLALGIGANTAIFSIVNSLVIAKLPVEAPEQLVQVSRNATAASVTNPIWEEIRNRPTLFSRAAAWGSTVFNLNDRGEVAPANGLWVSGGYFELFGVRPAIGRLLTASDDRRGGGADGPVAVLSYGFWQRRYGGDRAVLGQPLRLGGTPFTIVGVSTPDFFGAEVGKSFDVAIPLGDEPLTRATSALDARSNWWLRVIARLPAGQSIDDASRALLAAQPSIRAATLPSDIPPARQKDYLHAPMTLQAASTGVSNLRTVYREPLTILMVVVGLVLAIACANLANLLLARADGRRHEVSVRLALGASRLRVFRQLFVESLLLALVGAALGLIFADWSSHLLVRQISSATNVIALGLVFDWRVLAFTIGVTVLSALAFGIAPAWRATRAEPNRALRGQGRAVADSRRRFTGVLMAVQVSLSLVLVVGAALFVRTFTSLSGVAFGFDPKPLLIVSINAGRSARPPQARLAVLEDVRERVRALPGVDGAELSTMTPLAGQWDQILENPEGLSLPESDRDVYMNAVGPEWFKTYGIALLGGRLFTNADRAVTDAAPVIVNRAFVQRFFRDRQPIGQTVRLQGEPGTLAIVGVVADALYDSMRDHPPATMFRPLSAAPSVVGLDLTVHSATTAPAELAHQVAAAATAVDPALTTTSRPLADRIDVATARERILAMLSGFFGALALLLSGLGLYGVVSQAVARRRTEIAIRLALGASGQGLVGSIVLGVAAVVGLGIAVGSAVSLWASHFVEALLFGLQPRDASTFVAAAGTLLAVALLASWLPAYRASRLDPARVLRE